MSNELQAAVPSLLLGPRAGVATRARRGKKTPPDCAAKFQKTVMCRYFPHCARGQDCLYAHSAAELRSRPNFTKTRMCAGYQDGRCELAASECAFAHGPEDLRPLLWRDAPRSDAGAIGGEQRPAMPSADDSWSPKYIDLEAWKVASPSLGFKVGPLLEGIAGRSAADAMTPTESGASTPTWPAKVSHGSGITTPPVAGFDEEPLTLEWVGCLRASTLSGLADSSRAR